MKYNSAKVLYTFLLPELHAEWAWMACLFCPKRCSGTVGKGFTQGKRCKFSIVWNKVQSGNTKVPEFLQRTDKRYLQSI